MPFYTYTCPECGHKATKMRKVAERDDPAPCPLCSITCGDDCTATRHHPMTRDIAGPAFALKGKGWARDGYGG